MANKRRTESGLKILSIPDPCAGRLTPEWVSELHNGKPRDTLEVAEITGQHLIAERQCRGSDRQVSEGNHHASTLLLSIDFPASSAVSFVYGYTVRSASSSFRNDCRRKRTSGVRAR